MGLIKLIICFIGVAVIFPAYDIPQEIQFIGCCILCAGWIAYSEVNSVKIRKE